MENHCGAYRIIGTTECMNGESLGANRIIGTTECMNGESLGCLQNHWYYRMYEWRITGVLTESLVLQNV